MNSKALQRFALALSVCALIGLVSVQQLSLADEQKAAPKDAAKAATGAIKEGPQLLDARLHKVGQRFPNAPVATVQGKKAGLFDFSGQKGLIIAVHSVGCPLSKKYTPRLMSLQKELGAQGISVLVINPMEGDDKASIQAALKKYGLTLPYVKDAKGQLAKLLGAQRTTDVFLFDASQTLVYRGAIDDQYGLGYSLAEARRHYLKEAAAAMLAGLRPSPEATSAPGCELSHEAAALPVKDVTWYTHISRLVQRNCQECHRPGENGPFSLMTYKDVKSNRAMIKRVINDRSMPPWHADAKVGHWRNNRSLTDKDRQLFVKWIDAECPKGKEENKPTSRQWVKGWKLGKPQAVLRMPRPISVPAEGVVEYKYVPIMTKFGTDKWIKAIEIRPSATEVVHHVLVFLRYPRNHPRAKDQPRVRGGLRGYFAGMVPGQNTFVCPKGTAKFLPKGAVMIFQIHYTTNGVAQKDQTKIGLHFSDEPKHEIRTTGIYNTRFRIPPGDGNHKVVAERRFRKPTRILSFAPHMHVRGKAFKYEIVKADGSVKPICFVPRFDFNWQLTYELLNPLDLPAGTVIRCTAWFDNSDKNPANPDPKKTVGFGEQTWDEMMIGYMTGYELKGK